MIIYYIIIIFNTTAASEIKKIKTKNVGWEWLKSC